MQKGVLKSIYTGFETPLEWSFRKFSGTTALLKSSQGPLVNLLFIPIFIPPPRRCITQSLRHRYWAAWPGLSPLPLLLHTASECITSLSWCLKHAFDCPPIITPPNPRNQLAHSDLPTRPRSFPGGFLSCHCSEQRCTGKGRGPAPPQGSPVRISSWSVPFT